MAMLMTLRQACCHPTLVKTENGVQAGEAEKSDIVKGEAGCKEEIKSLHEEIAPEIFDQLVLAEEQSQSQAVRSPLPTVIRSATSLNLSSVEMNVKLRRMGE